jgi:hypothetical protein
VSCAKTTSVSLAFAGAVFLTIASFVKAEFLIYALASGSNCATRPLIGLLAGLEVAKWWKHLKVWVKRRREVHAFCVLLLCLSILHIRQMTQLRLALVALQTVSCTFTSILMHHPPVSSI